MGAHEAAAGTGSGGGSAGRAALPAPAAADTTPTDGHHGALHDAVKPGAGGDCSKDIEHEAASESTSQEEQAALLRRQRQRFGTTGFAHAGLFSRFTYLFVAPLVAMGARSKVRRPSGAHATGCSEAGDACCLLLPSLLRCSRSADPAGCATWLRAARSTRCAWQYAKPLSRAQEVPSLRGRRWARHAPVPRHACAAAPPLHIPQHSHAWSIHQPADQKMPSFQPALRPSILHPLLTPNSKPAPTPRPSATRLLSFLDPDHHC